MSSEPGPRAGVAGWHGKLPTRGDFVGRGLPKDWLAVWDEWLQRAMAAAARRIGGALLRERLLAMSPWQCVVVPEVAPMWHAVLVPSHDRVGRAFPMLLAEAIDGGTLTALPMGSLRRRGQRLADRMRDALPTASPRDFDQGVQRWTAEAWPATGDDGAGASPPAIGTLLPLGTVSRSYWWRLGGDGAEPEVFEESWPPGEPMFLEWLAVTD